MTGSIGMVIMKTHDVGRRIGELLKNKYLVCVLLAGIVLILLSSGDKDSEKKQESGGNGISEPVFSLQEQEQRLKKLIASIDGAGEAEVMLSLKKSASRELAEDESEYLIVSTGSGTQSAVSLSYDYPEYLGAVVVCSGADNAGVRLAVIQAVSAVTGLGSNRITVAKMK